MLPRRGGRGGWTPEAAAGVQGIVRDRADAEDEELHWVPVALGTLAEATAAVSRWQAYRTASGRSFEVATSMAPMLRATEGSGMRPGIMPWGRSTMQSECKALFDRVYDRMKAAGREAELPPIRQGEVRKFGSHSMRRTGTAMARTLSGRSGLAAEAFELAIDAHFRWDEAKKDSVMQLRYGGEEAARRRIAVVEWF